MDGIRSDREMKEFDSWTRGPMGLSQRIGAEQRPRPAIARRWIALCAFASVGWLAGCSPSSSGREEANTSTTSAPSATPASSASVQAAAVKCMRSNDLACAEANWSEYVKRRPTDVRAIANLGFVLNKQDKHEQAIAAFEKDIGMGAGSYDLFAFYADSLGKVGRTDEAIDWSYKTLKLMPSLVDVRENLARLLVSKKRNYEALTLLSEFDQYLDEHGESARFMANRMAIESSMHDLDATQDQEVTGLRLVKFKDTFFAPVSVGQSGVRAFVVDTGATSVVVNDDFLAAAKTPYTMVRAQVEAHLADGRVVGAKEVLIDQLMVGPIELHKVKALTCQSCELLLGANALSAFTMTVAQIKGVDVATLVPRVAPHS